MHIRREGGFTIIEVMIVLAVVAVLLTLIFLAVPQLRALQSRTQAHRELNTIVQAAVVAQQYRGQPLRLITGSGCSNCACRPPATLTNATCISNWNNALNKISIAGLDISHLTSDPWGNPYLLDENEGEPGLPSCTKDSIKSAGPDSIYNNSDDINLSIPLHQIPCY